MLPPLDEEERERLLPTWVKDALKATKPRERRFKVGDRVYNALYGPKFGNPFGTVTGVAEEENWSQGIGVEHDDDCKAGTIAAYYVAVPPEHDPKR